MQNAVASAPAQRVSPPLRVPTSRRRCACASSRRTSPSPAVSAQRAPAEPAAAAGAGVERRASLPASLPLLALPAALLLGASDALATGGELGILEGRTSALIHPAIMLFLFGATAYTGWLGYNWRRARALIPEEIAALKARMPAPAGPDAPMQPEAVALQAQVEALGAERKQLLSEGVKDNHFSWGSLLLSLGVAAGVVGPLNTYIRTGKLFPGPHLYAGAGIVVLWAAAAALVPQMQKNNDAARNAHIALNMVNLGLFAWQIPTGLEIVGKVFEFTKWP